MFAQRLFSHAVALMADLIYRLIYRFIFSRWARDYEEHNDAYENVCAARIGPLHLEVNQCFVLEHDDASISARIPLPGGKLRLGYMVCRGADRIRQPGFYKYWQKRPPKAVYDKACRPDSGDAFPF